MFRFLFALTCGFIIGAVIIEQKQYLTNSVAVPVAFLPDGGRYDGRLLEGELSGLGRIAWPNGDFYEGEFQDGLFHGLGTLKQSDQVYEGEFVGGVASGKGKILFKDGRRYEGEVIHGKASGLGLMVTPDGEYVGHFKNNQFNGKGRWISDSGQIYDGEFKDDLFHGKGTYTDTEGRVYQGTFEAGAITGDGEYRDAETRYTGTFKDWLFEGEGILINAEGRYEGDFLAGQFHGSGVYQSTAGLIYRGHFANGLYHGQGIMEFNGERYQGGFEYGVPNGEGSLVYGEPVDGVERIKGVWRYGELISSDNKLVENDSSKIVEYVLYSQAQKVQSIIDSIDKEDPNLSELYFVGVAGDGSQGVFRREVNYVHNLFDKHFGTEGKSAVLINGNVSFKQVPLATLTSIEQLLQGVAAKMDPENDILFVFFTSHGSADFQFQLNQQGLELQSLSAEAMGRILRSLPVRHKVVVISSCYAGGYVGPVKDDQTMLMVASAADKTSFGCSDRREMTYFGEALFKDAFLQSPSFVAAFDLARHIVRGMEAKEGFEFSNPLIFKPKAIVEQLSVWRKQLKEWQAIQNRTIESDPSEL